MPEGQFFQVLKSSLTVLPCDLRLSRCIAQDRRPSGSTASNTEALCQSVYTGSIQAQHTYCSAGTAPLATGITHRQEVFQPRLPLLLVCSPAVAIWEV